MSDKNSNLPFSGNNNKDFIDQSKIKYNKKILTVYSFTELVEKLFEKEQSIHH